MTTEYTHKYLQVEGHRIAYLDEGTGPPVLLRWCLETGGNSLAASPSM